MTKEQLEMIIRGCLMVAYGLGLQEKDIEYETLISDITNAAEDFFYNKYGDKGESK